MRVAIWDILPVEVFSSVAAQDSGVSFISLPLERCRDALTEGIVDAALLPVLDVLCDPDEFDVFPAVSLSSWSFPFAKIILKGGLGSQLESLAFPKGHDLAAFVARVILREHYQSEPRTIARDHRTAVRLADGEEDAYLVFGPGVPNYKPGLTTLDLGQEWYELANYPMVWGLFATVRGRGTPALIVALRDAVVGADEARQVYAESARATETIKNFVEHELRLRLDDLAVASLTELTNYVYYYGITEEAIQIPFVSLPDDDAGSGPTPLPSL